jgi:ubiquinone/menaquinone biosynthesis C-methylase UbiE
MATRSKFVEDQYRFFDAADVRHFLWQTRNPYFARTERALLEGFAFGPDDSVLEVGCGEGGNLANLFATHRRWPRRLVGLDLFHPKLVFAGEQLPAARFVCADAGRLPFPDATFERILCRDLIHHLPEPDAALRELRRVARPGGTVWVIEPNGKNPLVRALAMIRPHERGQLRNSVDSIADLVGRHFSGATVDVRQPFPFSRALLHYQFGLPSLGRSRAFGVAMDRLERALTAMMPRRRWAYIVARIDEVAPARG